MRLGLEPIHASLLAALGLATASCGSRTVGGDGGGGSGGASGSGPGGSSDGGGATGGTASGGTTNGSSTPGGVGSGSSASTASSGTTTSATTSSSTPSASTTSSTTSTPQPTCENPEPILQRGVPGAIPTGFVRCADGSIHRVEAVECRVPVMPGSASCENLSGACSADADCTDRPHGQCVEDDLFYECFCRYGCATDMDCAPDEVCACGGDGPYYPYRSMCIPALDCTTDADCGAELCGLVGIDDGCGYEFFQLACFRDTDECRTTPECNVDEGGCVADANGRHCEDWCCCGRPFFVEGDVRSATPVRRSDWCEGGPRPDTSALDAQARSVLADAWTRLGLMEHASVASFARFVLQLLGEGAPPELIADAQRALADEIDHAKLCFGLASGYAGDDVGPGPLDVGGALADAATGDAVLEGVIREACIGETLSAIEAAEALEQAEDPAVRAALSTIVADEMRHAQLGWRYLQQLLACADAETFAQARTLLAAAMAEAAAMVGDDDPGDVQVEVLRRHGIIDAALRREVRSRALREVLEPFAARLFDDLRAA